ncbi:hypothetical protein K503DRAFT_860294 [Rhizopogon vinicolor AM-OR11-026]|uniref:Uncharacterized protein n=1 Tax=Rhizopogon vinicolor AM-OR11-026 TaxID=1314800 RepID=A0A1B7MIQ9_9AGAM|nr:hypothetical protein K503DRAFT_860294 [Rhizopogon vinicolor AM-OR11-026]
MDISARSSDELDGSLDSIIMRMDTRVAKVVGKWRQQTRASLGLGARNGRELGTYSEGYTDYVHMAQDAARESVHDRPIQLHTQGVAVENVQSCVRPTSVQQERNDTTAEHRDSSAETTTVRKVLNSDQSTVSSKPEGVDDNKSKEGEEDNRLARKEDGSLSNSASEVSERSVDEYEKAESSKTEQKYDS